MSTIKELTKEDFENAISQTLTMAQAASELGIHFSTFKRHAVKYGLYNPNQGAKGTKKPINDHRKINLDDILEGKYPQYQTFKLKNRLFKEGLKNNICEVCGISEWQGMEIKCELDHINGKSNDHRLENLRILCPNCHSQTETYRFKRGYKN